MRRLLTLLIALCLCYSVAVAGPYKNVASQKVYVFATDEDGDSAAGDAGNITANISKDGAATNPTDDTNPTDLGEGIYVFSLTQAETNCDSFCLIPSSTTVGVKLHPVTCYTTPGDSSGLSVDMVAISDDTTAADNLEAILDGTGNVGLTLEWIVIDNDSGVGLSITGSTDGVNFIGEAGPGFSAVATGGNNNGMTLAGFGSGEGLSVSGGLTGEGIEAKGGGTSGSGILAWAQSGNHQGLELIGNGTGAGMKATGGATGSGIRAEAVGSSAAIFVSYGGNGSGLYLLGNGSGDGLKAVGGGTGDGIEAQGGATSGHGFYARAWDGTSHGIYGLGGGGGAGMTLEGEGAGHGFSTTGGTTGHGSYHLGGATSGDGFYAAGQTLGHGMTLVGTGALRYDLNADVHGTLDLVTDITTKTGYSLADGSVVAATFAANAITDAAVANDVQVDALTIETVDASTYIESRTLPTVDYYASGDDLALLQATTIATLANQTSFTLTAGSADDGAYKNHLAILVDGTTAAQKSTRQITAYIGATKTVTLASGPDFTIEPGDIVRILVTRDTVVEVGP